MEIAAISRMGLPYIAVVGVISLSWLLPSSCSKTPAPQQHAQAAVTNSPAAPSQIKALGMIQLTNHCETEIDLGKGESCTIVPNLLDRHNLQLLLSFGSKDALGRPTGLWITRVTARPDQPLDITVNDMSLTFTPKLTE